MCFHGPMLPGPGCQLIAVHPEQLHSRRCNFLPTALVVIKACLTEIYVAWQQVYIRFSAVCQSTWRCCIFRGGVWYFAVTPLCQHCCKLHYHSQPSLVRCSMQRDMVVSRSHSHIIMCIYGLTLMKPPAEEWWTQQLQHCYVFGCLSNQESLVVLTSSY